MIALRLVLLLLAVVALLAAAIGVQCRINLVALGLLFWLVSRFVQ